MKNKKLQFPRKLKRDSVVSIVRNKELVGIYWANTNGKEVIFECNPKIANKIIKIWNNQ